MSDQSSDRSGPWGGGRSAVSTLRIREAVQDDIAELARLITELGYPTSPTEMRGRLHAIRSDPDYHTLVAQADDGLAGLVGVRLGRHYEKNEPFA